MSIHEFITVKGATEHNLKNIDVQIRRGAITVVTGVSGSGKSSLAFDTILAESQRRFFYTLSHYSRQFLDLGTKPAVKNITGLSPSISLAQNETAPSRRATLGSLTDISELLAVAYARFGTQLCPKHRKPTSAMSQDDIIKHISATANGQNIALVVPLAESKKGIFRKELTQYLNKGFTKVWIDEKLLDLDPVPVLEREEKHTIKILIDLLKVKSESPERLMRGVTAVLEHSGGFGEWIPVVGKGDWDVENKQVFSTKAGCPECGFAWPKLDSRYFNSNSLGRCESCDGYGIRSEEEVIDSGEEDYDGQSLLEATCTDCYGTGIQRESEAIVINDLPIHSLVQMPVNNLYEIFVKLPINSGLQNNPAFMRVHSEISSGLKRLVDMKLGYLSLSRRVRSLSGGESQRVKLSGILSENLRGILYVLDEPSQGLHHTELSMMINHLRNLRDQGNTIIIVDHDEDIIRSADEIIDLGPTGGAQGGHILGTFAPKDAKQWISVSKTANWLMKPKSVQKRKSIDRSSNQFLTISHPKLNNLKFESAKIPLETMTCITGVSGAGKSSFVLGVLFPNLILALQSNEAQSKTNRSSKTKADSKWQNCSGFSGYENVNRVELIDRRPVAKSSVSMPATYLDILGDFRDLFASLPDAQIAGLTAKSFSMHLEGGRCPECKGKGELNLSMRFLADARIQCPTCQGKRFRPHVLDVKFSGLSIYDVLNLSVDEAVIKFANHRKIVQKLAPAQRLGLGYLKLGQPSASLSGGEAQRLKMVPYFTKKMGLGSVLILDEPTTGLHFEDVANLVAVMRELVDLGVTLIVVEHNDEVIHASDWCITLGPGAADEGGQVIYAGIPKEARP